MGQIYDATWGRMFSAFYDRAFEATEQPDIDRGLKVAYLDLEREYTSLKDWAGELNARVIEVESNRGYRIFKRLKRL